MEHTGDTLKNADLFEGEKYLIPGSLCYVDKRYRVQSRGTLKTAEKISDIRKVVLDFPGTREIMFISANGGPNPQLFTELKDDEGSNNVSEAHGSDSTVIPEIRDKVLIALLEQINNK